MYQNNPKHFISYNLFDAMLVAREEHSFYKPPFYTEELERIWHNSFNFIDLGSPKKIHIPKSQNQKFHFFILSDFILCFILFNSFNIFHIFLEAVHINLHFG